MKASKQVGKMKRGKAESFKFREYNEEEVSATVIDWINIENYKGITPLECSREKVKEYLLKNGAKKGRGETLKEKISRGIEFKELMKMLRWCGYDDNEERIEEIVRCLDKSWNGMLEKSVQGWCRGKMDVPGARKRSRMMHKEKRNKFWNKVPRDIYGLVGKFIGDWYEIKERGSLLIDELGYDRNGKSKVYERLIERSAKHSNGYISDKLLKKNDKMYPYKAHWYDLAYFLKYSSSKAWEYHKIDPVCKGFIKHAMSNGDARLVRLIFSHTAMRLIRPEALEDLLHYAVTRLENREMEKILIEEGAVCKNMDNKCRGCARNEYEKKSIKR